MIVGNFYPSCFQPTYNAVGTPFADAYALSWTTFTTVVSYKMSVSCKYFLESIIY